jgi:hypothetical protein
MVYRVSAIIFFIIFGISYFLPFNYAGLIDAIAALVAGIALLANA